jgi:hypothetical protein
MKLSSAARSPELCGVGRQLVEDGPAPTGLSQPVRKAALAKTERNGVRHKNQPRKTRKRMKKAGVVASSKNAKTSPNTADPKAKPNYAGDKRNTDPAPSQPPPSQGGDPGPALFTFTNGRELRSSDWPQGWISGAQIATKLKAVTNCAQNAVSHKLTNEELLERQEVIESCGHWANQLGGVEPGKKRMDDIREAFSVIGNLIAEGLHKLNLPLPSPPNEGRFYRLGCLLKPPRVAGDKRNAGSTSLGRRFSSFDGSAAVASRTH